MIKKYEFLSEIYEAYEYEIQQYTDKQLIKDNVQDKKGIYLDNDKGICDYEDALQYYGWDWVHKQVKNGRITEMKDLIF